ncbi:MAG: response regulator transcription factor [Bifidobacteriaceae bacterium]|nr:response regulator transcription factor [Bifidobacteriaceae bacterium]
MRVLIVDDDPFVTQSLATILGATAGVEVVGTGHTASAAERLWQTLEPDVGLLDIQMGAAATGLDAGRAILARWPRARVVFLTTFVDDSYIAAALRMGAKGYLVKQDVAAIAPALSTVMAGGSVFGEAVAGRLDALMAPAGPDFALDRLTEREAQITALVSEGLDNREIAERVCLTEGTVRNVVSAVLGKLGLRSRTGLASWYLGGTARTRAADS